MSSALDWQQLRHWFEVACDLPAAQRRARLQAEGLDLALIEEVLALCEAETGTAAFAAPVLGVLGELAAPELEPGARIGPYRVLSTLAEGGMGRVYLAERDDGEYRQKVAIKRLRGLASMEGQARFKRERQILADLQHPHIARLLDGGQSEDGQPYLVMEYIEGQRIDRWAEGRPLGERLRMFIAVCRALAFAHGRLVLHCDLKPSNVLVRGDGTPALLDFGIARFLDEPTRVAEGAGDYLTPQYASPEQKRGEALSVASDLFALGRILEAMLRPRALVEAGTLPVGSRAARQQARAMAMPADLAAIVAKAAAPDPSARYASALELADDVQRFLDLRPVLARPAGRAYRLLRFVQRQRLGVAVAAAFLATVALFVWNLAEQRDRALAAERLARQEAETSEEVIGFLVSIFDAADPGGGGRPDLTARELLDGARDELATRLGDRPVLRRRLATTLGWIYQRIGLPGSSLELFGSARSLLDAQTEPRERVLLRDALAHALWLADRGDEAEREARQAVAEAEAELPEAPVDLAQALNTLGMILHRNGRYDEAEEHLQRALALREAALGEDHENVAASLHNLALVAKARDRLDQAAALFERAQAIKEAQFGPRHPRILNGLQQLAMLRRDQGRLDEALALTARVLELRLAVHGADSVPAASAHNEMGSMLHDLGRYREAMEHYRESLRAYEASLGADSPSAAVSMNNLASVLEDRGEFKAAEALFRRSLAIRIQAHGEAHPAVARARNNLGRVLLRQDRLDEARALLEQALAQRLALFGEAHRETLGSRALLADALRAEGRLEAALAAFEALQPQAERMGLFPTALAGLQRLHAASLLAAGRNESADARLAQAENALQALPAEHPLRAELALERLLLARPGLAPDEFQRRLAGLRRILAPELSPQAPALRKAERLARS
jgi:eukaryotic-like serine/threonine-protein kinase